MKKSRPVAVTGAGCVSAIGPNLAACMDSLFEGRRAPGPPTLFSSAHGVRSPVFEVPERFIPPHIPREKDLLRTSRLALVAAGEALADAGWETTAGKRAKVGVCVGTTVGSAMNNEDFYREYRGGGRPGMKPIRRYLDSNPAFTIARHFGFTGPCQTIVNACSSGTDAVGVGMGWVNAGVCDAVVAGGADELCRVTYNGFSSLMITDGAPCRPFDRDRKGLNLGEGAAMLILEGENSPCRARGEARGYVLGYGSASDAYHLTAPRPDGSGLRRAIADALAESGLDGSRVSFVNAHGTGTRDNDLVEGVVLHDLLPGVPYVSTKGHTGHTLGAAGAVEAVFTLASLEIGRVPANAGYSTPDPEIPASPLQAERAVAGDIAMTDSLAFGGNNAVLIFRRGGA